MPFKEGLGITEASKIVDSKFLENVSRGKLSHPPTDLFDLSMYYYAFFKAWDKKCCDKTFLQAYQMIYESTVYDFPNIGGIYKRFSNSFFKAFVKEQSDLLRKTKDENQLKKRKLNN